MPPRVRRQNHQGGHLFPMKIIKLGSKKIALVDDCDYAKVKNYRWRQIPQGDTHYAIATIFKNGRPSSVRMHRLIMGFPDGLIDHKNGRGFDNQRANLRLATPSQNNMNRRKLIAKSSIYKGVQRLFKNDVWISSIRLNGKITRLGKFKKEIDAARAYNRAASEKFGDFACFNPSVGNH